MSSGGIINNNQLHVFPWFDALTFDPSLRWGTRTCLCIPESHENNMVLSFSGIRCVWIDIINKDPDLWSAACWWHPSFIDSALRAAPLPTISWCITANWSRSQDPEVRGAKWATQRTRPQSDASPRSSEENTAQDASWTSGHQTRDKTRLGESAGGHWWRWWHWWREGEAAAPPAGRDNFLSEVFPSQKVLLHLMSKEI